MTTRLPLALQQLLAQRALQREQEWAALVATEDDVLLTPEQVARLVGKTRRWVYNHQHELQGQKLGRRTLRFRASSVRAYLNGKDHTP